MWIQGGDTPKNVVPSHMCQRYAVHSIHSVTWFRIQWTCLVPIIFPYPLVCHENNTALLRLEGEQTGFPATLLVFVAF